MGRGMGGQDLLLGKKRPRSQASEFHTLMRDFGALKERDIPMPPSLTQEEKKRLQTQRETYVFYAKKAYSQVKPYINHQLDPIILSLTHSAMVNHKLDSVGE